MPNVSLTAKPLLPSSACLRSMSGRIFSSLFNCVAGVIHGWRPRTARNFFAAATTWFAPPIAPSASATFFSVLMIMVGMLISSRAETRWDGYWADDGRLLPLRRRTTRRALQRRFNRCCKASVWKKSCSQTSSRLSPADTLEDALGQGGPHTARRFPRVPRRRQWPA